MPLKLNWESRNKKFNVVTRQPFLKWHHWKINRLPPIHTSNVLLKFGLDIQSQTIGVQKPKNPICPPGSHFESDRHHWKSLSFCPQLQTTCIWNLTFKFQSKLNLCSGNHATYRVKKQQGKSEGFESCDRPIVRKRTIWVKIGDVLYLVTLKFDGWPWKTIGHLSFAVSSFVQHFIAIGELKLELQSWNAQFGSNSTIFRAVWPWNLTYDLEKQ